MYLVFVFYFNMCVCMLCVCSTMLLCSGGDVVLLMPQRPETLNTSCGEHLDRSITAEALVRLDCPTLYCVCMLCVCCTMLLCSVGDVVLLMPQRPETLNTSCGEHLDRSITAETLLLLLYYYYINTIIFLHKRCFLFFRY